MIRIQKNNDKAQNEIVGFVIIVVIVVLIGLFLLVFYLNSNRHIEISSKNAENFLKASLLYTTSCREIDYLDMKELIKKCYNKESCLENNSCLALNETYLKMLEDTWRIKSNRAVNSYTLDIYYRENSSSEGGKIIQESILYIKQGNCTGTISGGETFFRQGEGDIFLNIKICSV